MCKYVDTTITGSRNEQAALFLWHSLRKKGMEGIREEVTSQTRKTVTCATFLEYLPSCGRCWHVLTRRAICETS